MENRLKIFLKIMGSLMIREINKSIKIKVIIEILRENH